MNVLDKLRQAATKEESFDDMASDVRQAWSALVGPSAEYDSYVSEVYPTHAIVCVGSDHYRVPYARSAEGVISFAVEDAVEVERTWTDVQKLVKIEKTDDDRQLAFGWAYVMTKDGEQVTDHSGEFIDDVKLIEDAAYAFNLDYREGDERHTEAVTMKLVESFVVTAEKLEKLGLSSDALPTGWWTGWYVEDPAVFAKVKNGEYPMLSIGGWAQKEDVDA